MRGENYIFIVLLLLLSCIAHDLRVYGRERYNVSVYNGLPNNNEPFVAHVFSGDNELGYHNLKVGQIFSWTFKMQTFDRTNFFAHFWWGNSKEQKFSVFNKSMVDFCGKTRPGINFCWWQVQEDGFHLANVFLPAPVGLTKMYSWDNKTHKS